MSRSREQKLKGFRFPVSESYAVYITGLSDKGEIENLSDDVVVAAKRAVTRATEKARTAANRKMRDQINWAARYLDGKLEMHTPTAAENEGRIDVRWRPTSLARFVVGTKTPFKGGVRLHVGAASFTTSKRMFIVPLKRGNADITEETRNLGLAIRLKPGEKITGKYNMKAISKGLYLLYAPSPAQVFYTVAEDLMPDVQVWVDDEFQRQIKLLGAA